MKLNFNFFYYQAYYLCFKCFEVNHIKIIRFNDSLIYLNASTLKAFCNEVCPVERPNRRNKIFEKVS